MREETRTKLLNTILILIIGLNLLLIGYNLNYKTVIVKGSSMEPTYYSKNKLTCEKSPKNIQIGQVIGFYLDGQAIIHRVIDKKEYNGIVYYITKGDNNQNNDFIPITKENIYCRVVERER